MILSLPGLMLKGIRDMWSHPWAQLFTLAGVTLTTFLAGLFVLLLFNVGQEISRQQGQVEFQVYWSKDADQNEVKAQWESLGKWENLEEIQTFTSTQALRELAAEMGRDITPKAAGKSSLPPTALLVFQVPESDPQWTRVLFEKLKNQPEVADVHFNPLQMDAARSWVTASERFIWPLIGLLALASGLLVGNTVKLAQMARRDEIEILRLVGASRTYIRLPLICGGMALGLAGGLLGTGLLKLFQMAARELLLTPPLLMELHFPPLHQAAILVAGPVLAGLLGSWAAIRN
ncbi:MAG: cell division protein FtsX [Desulfovibrio sp.]|uniref:cell division protein FtsX n=1 Tax=Desulfovibrio sp. 7SRBS1 TaxID=3378064 RepID=UPI003B3F2F7F